MVFPVIQLVSFSFAKVTITYYRLFDRSLPQHPRHGCPHLIHYLSIVFSYIQPSGKGLYRSCGMSLENSREKQGEVAPRKNGKRYKMSILRLFLFFFPSPSKRQSNGPWHLSRIHLYRSAIIFRSHVCASQSFLKTALFSKISSVPTLSNRSTVQQRSKLFRRFRHSIFREFPTERALKFLT